MAGCHGDENLVQVDSMVDSMGSFINNVDIFLEITTQTLYMIVNSFISELLCYYPRGRT